MACGKLLRLYSRRPRLNMALGHSEEAGAHSRISAHRISAFIASPFSNAELPSSSCFDNASGVGFSLGQTVRSSVPVHGRAPKISIARGSSFEDTVDSSCFTERFATFVLQRLQSASQFNRHRDRKSTRLTSSHLGISYA